ncbi:MAG: TIGR03564 family F420-dependent LLM class oxidoreductase [Chloroflexota bacterium]|nr:TIGR03564 family F420-dependent LLM class oxidoreductase [Chloroflexota bacterium]MDE2895294.1 TIGR03564 family F420-dependent LLM class oxidoreductase [Chloroflexota bacterium]
MRILSPPLASTLAGKLDQIRQLEADGFDGAYLPSVGHDAMTVLALAAGETSTIELGTYVIPTYTRHPVAMAQQALATNAAAGGRFTLGLGLSHEVVIRDSWGLDFNKVVRHIREYLDVLQPLMRGEQVDYEGEEFQVHSKLELPDCEPPSVIVAALGPQMLRVTGRLADGTALWLAGPKWIEEVVIPEMGGAARDAGRPEPRIIAGVPISITADPEGARERISRAYAMYNTLPSYQRVIQGSGADDPAGVSIVGSEEEVERELRRWRDVGVTDFYAAFEGANGEERQRTREFVAALAPSL